LDQKRKGPKAGTTDRESENQRRKTKDLEDGSVTAKTE
jgi:hypothetical protein